MSQKQDDAIERAVDVIRLALSAISRAWTDTALVRALSVGISQSKAGAALHNSEDRENAAWDTIRPALRKLVEDVTTLEYKPTVEIEKGKP